MSQDDTAAVAWLRRAAEQGQLGAQHNLGRMYLDGRGVSRDDETALAWIRPAAEQGGPYAQATLGYLYETGRGVARDVDTAVRWYRRAADRATRGPRSNSIDFGEPVFDILCQALRRQR